jgi:hypothetical protein
MVMLLNVLETNSSRMDVLVNAPSKLLTVSHVLRMAEFSLEIVLPFVALMRFVLLNWVRILLVSLNHLLLLPLALVSPWCAIEESVTLVPALAVLALLVNIVINEFALQGRIVVVIITFVLTTLLPMLDSSVSVLLVNRRTL